jgi:hypothetical protein
MGQIWSKWFWYRAAWSGEIVRSDISIFLAILNSLIVFRLKIQENNTSRRRTMAQSRFDPFRKTRLIEKRNAMRVIHFSIASRGSIPLWFRKSFTELSSTSSSFHLSETSLWCRGWQTQKRRHTPGLPDVRVPELGLPPADRMPLLERSQINFLGLLLFSLSDGLPISHWIRFLEQGVHQTRCNPIIRKSVQVIWVCTVDFAIILRVWHRAHDLFLWHRLINESESTRTRVLHFKANPSRNSRECEPSPFRLPFE